MKNHILTLLFLALASAAMAQPFSLFSENTAKDFAPLTETWERNYSLKIDSLFQNEGISEFFLHTVMNENETADFDPGSGEQFECDIALGCYKNSGATGFGAKVYSSGSGNYVFINPSGDTLHFDFTTDSTVFFENSQEVYALVFEDQSEQTVIGITEQVRSYRIAHYDTGGIEIASPLHGYVISIGESIGLIDFFLVDEFPQIEIPLTLIGDSALDQSLSVLTGEMIYDFEAGDTIQYKMTYFQFNPSTADGPIQETSYKNHIYLSRVDEADSLRYTVLNQTFDEGETNLEEWIEEQVFARFDTLSALPFYRRRFTDGYQDASYQESLFKRELCDGIRIGIRGISGPFRYCENYNAWCGFDTDGPPEITRFEYVPGLGRIFHEVARNGFGTVTTRVQTTEMIYFSKGGIGCGIEAILSAENADHPGQTITVYPNPTRNHFRIRMDQGLERFKSVELCDTQGRVVRTWPAGQAEFIIDGLPSGMYVVRAAGKEGVYTQKMIVN